MNGITVKIMDVKLSIPVFTESGQEKILDMLTSKEDLNTLDIVTEVNKAEYWKDF